MTPGGNQDADPGGVLEIQFEIYTTRPPGTPTPPPVDNDYRITGSGDVRITGGEATFA